MSLVSASLFITSGFKRVLVSISAEYETINPNLTSLIELGALGTICVNISHISELDFRGPVPVLLSIFSSRR